MNAHVAEGAAGCQRERVPDYLACSNVIDSTNNVVDFQPPSRAQDETGGRALALVYEAADAIKKIDEQANERHAHAEALAVRAIEKVKAVDDRALCAESARRAAEAKIGEYEGRVKQLTAKLEEAEKSADARIRVAESARQAAERRLAECTKSVRSLAARVDEIENAMKKTVASHAAAQIAPGAGKKRAIEAENALMSIEAAIRSQILQKNFDDPGKVVIAAG